MLHPVQLRYTQYNYCYCMFPPEKSQRLLDDLEHRRLDIESHEYEISDHKVGYRNFNGYKGHIPLLAQHVNEVRTSLEVNNAAEGEDVVTIKRSVAAQVEGKPKQAGIQFGVSVVAFTALCTVVRLAALPFSWYFYYE
jgi:hypothetical protein